MMKKKIAGIVSVVLLALGVAACGPKVTKEAMKCTLEQEGVSTVMYADAEGDKITQLTQVTTIDLSGMPDENKEYIDSVIDATKEQVSGINGVDYNIDEKDGVYTETFVMNVKDNLDEIVDSGIVPIETEGDQDVEYLSVDGTKQALEAAGWTVEK